MSEKRKMLRYDEADVFHDLLSNIKWQSADKDNMEFTARITYSQMDNIRQALEGYYPNGW